MTSGSYILHSLCGDTVVVTHTSVSLIFPTINGDRVGAETTFPAKETIRFTISGCGVHLMTVKVCGEDFFLNGRRKSVNTVSLMRTSIYS